MIRRFVFVLALSVAAQPTLAGESLFDRFKTLCIDTRADPAAVKRAAEAAGGKIVQGIYINAAPANITGSNWSIDGFILTVGATHVPSIMGAPAVESASCLIHSTAPDKGALERLREWAGVPPDKGTVFYTFLEKDGKHLPVHIDIANRPEVLASGNVWELRAGQFEDTVSLTHYLRP